MVSATPSIPSGLPENTPSVKEATPQYILEDNEMVEYGEMIALGFEDIAAQEIITIARHDTVSGQPIIYQPIKNISQLAIKYGPQAIVQSKSSSKSYFDNFAIKLEDYIPEEGNGIGGSHVYIDSNNSLVIELVNVNNDEEVQVQILKSGDINNDTIY